MNEIILMIQKEFATNDMFTAFVGGSLFASLLYMAKSLPSKIYAQMVRLSTTKVTFNNDDDKMFSEMLVLLDKKNPMFRRASYSAITEYLGNNVHKMKMGLGYGVHYFSFDKRPVRVEYMVDKDVKGGLYDGPVERIIMTFLSRNPRKIIQGIIDAANKNTGSDNLSLYDSSSGYWSSIKGVPKRPLNTVFIEHSKKKFITDVINTFQDSKEWCSEKGIPWKVSFLFAGKPGTGKTSIVRAIASEFDMPLYFLSLSSVESDSQLFDLVRSVPENAILLVEDVDRAMVSSETTIEGQKSSTQAKSNKKSITMSGLLNALDGVMTPQGRITIMTTNHEEKLDPALIRAGRVDHRLDFDVMSDEIQQEMKRHLDIPDDYDITGKSASEIEVISKTRKISVDEGVL